jgi:hypothetical protein
MSPDEQQSYQEKLVVHQRHAHAVRQVQRRTAVATCR